MPQPPALTGPSLSGVVRALWSLVTPLAFTPTPPTHSGVRYREKSTRGTPPLADVFIPERRGPHPSVLLVHGGGFMIGHRGMKPVSFLATRLVNTGFAVASIDYRLLFRGGSIANSVQDVDDALSWWRSQTETYNLNPNRISAMGLSAGAALALLAAERHADALAHTVVWFGVYDFDELHGLLGQMVHRFLLKNEDSKAWSPIERVTKLPTPLLALHGTADRLIDYRQAERFRDARLQAGLPTELITYEGLPHGFLNNAKGPMALAAVEEVIAALRS